MRFDKCHIFFFFLISLSYQESIGQYFIGVHKDDIKIAMKTSYPMLKLNTDYVNPHFNYLKYEDRINEITVLFFLSDDDKCMLIRKMCDYSNINDVVKELNQRYGSSESNQWQGKENGKDISITMDEGDWYFTITTKEKM